MCGVELLQLLKMCPSIFSMKGLMFCKFCLYTTVSQTDLCTTAQQLLYCISRKSQFPKQTGLLPCVQKSSVYCQCDLTVLLSYIHRAKTKCDMAVEVALLLTRSRCFRSTKKMPITSNCLTAQWEVHVWCSQLLLKHLYCQLASLWSCCEVLPMRSLVQDFFFQPKVKYAWLRLIRFKLQWIFTCGNPFVRMLQCHL